MGAGTYTIDPADATEHFVTITGNLTLTPDASWPDNVGVMVYVIQGGSGGFTITFDAGAPFQFPDTIAADTADDHYTAFTIWRANFPATGVSYIVRQVGDGLPV